MALLFNAFAPLLAHAFAGNDVFLELCTARGIERIAADDSGEVPGNATSPMHCPFCLLQHTPFIPVSPLTGGLLPVVVAEAPPPLFLRAPRPLFAWAAARPRAPPFVA